MDIRKLQRVIVDGLEDVKAQNIVVFNTEHLSPLFERVIVASGTSNRQTRSLAASVRDAVKSAGEPSPRTEGEDNGEWIIVDCGAAVVHVMQPAIREYYHLEELWGDKPVRMKIGAVSSMPKTFILARRKPGTGFVAFGMLAWQAASRVGSAGVSTWCGTWIVSNAPLAMTSASAAGAPVPVRPTKRTSPSRRKRQWRKWHEAPPVYSGRYAS